MDRDEMIREMLQAFLKGACRNGIAPIFHEEGLAAALARAEELGFKLLPREPSDEMLAASKKKAGLGPVGSTEVYQAAWDAAGEKP